MTTSEANSVEVDNVNLTCKNSNITIPFQKNVESIFKRTSDFFYNYFIFLYEHLEITKNAILPQIDIEKLVSGITQTSSSSINLML